ncbi:competence protein TfoX [Leptotrichia sp. OH3620_COT-345]|uniref:TfoX/Sxy family protein n=1 Tax=Leptotrichia sp. OH3620_COT-345 TaxID=2491048 RepID=UPI000F651421|nr:competence protein TfoX [Leptotrichia sp. OH3620_COT-345]RRD39317.1 competence protein TfoX [Leptotrichia sp. OH3620_COT-345]
MASSKEYLNHILEKLSGVEEISYRKMMGEYIIYYREKVIGGIYDNRFLIKSVKAILKHMPDAIYEIPYEGANKMLLIDFDNIGDEKLLIKLFEDMYEKLPEPKRRKI